MFVNVLTDNIFPHQQLKLGIIYENIPNTIYRIHVLLKEKSFEAIKCFSKNTQRIYIFKRLTSNIHFNSLRCFTL